MQERSLFWQAIGVFIISLIVLAVVGVAVWFSNRADSLMLGSSPPLPSGVPPLNAYLVTIVLGLLALASGGFTLAAVHQSRALTQQFGWAVYGLVGVPLLLVLFAPLQRSGHEAFLGLPEWLVAAEGRGIIGVALGGLFFGKVDLIRFVPTFSKDEEERSPRVSGSAVRGLPGRFTPNAWRALSFMQEEAQRFEHAYMGTEHLLLGLLHDSRSQATRVLVNLGAEPASVKTQLEGVIGRRGTLYTGGTGMTRRCQRVIESGARLARAGGQRTVSTGHLLQALVESPEDVAGQLLDGLGITADRVGTELRHIGPEGE